MKDRFTVVYRLTGSSELARAKAQDICLEQTVEVPADVPPRYLGAELGAWMIGHIESIEEAGPDAHEARISFPAESSAYEITQLLNVIFGNISIKPGIRVQSVELPASLLSHFKGPRFGRAGLRQWLNAPDRPLLCGTLKPMGLSTPQIAGLAFQMAVGGLDLIKDDHGLSDQPYAPFEARVQACAEAVAKANRETGRRCAYFPNVTAPADKLLSRARFAKQAGAGGMLFSPALGGYDAMRMLADDDDIALPILSHPAYVGSMVTHKDNGWSHGALFGWLNRMAGADGAIFPNFGGRFSFSKEECAEIRDATAAPLGHIKPIYPNPGGGMTLARVADMNEMYGKDVIYLIGGGLLTGDSVVESCRFFRQLVEPA
jgi:ribulose-bisphosphate carboxylase large chain